MSTPIQHNAELAYRSTLGVFDCCKGTDKPFSKLWIVSIARVTERYAPNLLDDPVAVFDLIAAHLTAGRDDEHTRATVDDERGLVAVGGNVEIGVRGLADRLSGITVVTVEERPDPNP